MNPYQKTVIERLEKDRQVPFIVVCCLTLIVIPPILWLAVSPGIEQNLELNNSTNSSRPCLVENLDANRNIILRVCAPYFESEKRETHNSQITVHLHNTLLQLWTGDDCNLLINWLRSCSRDDLVGCPLLFPQNPKQCVKKVISTSKLTYVSIS